MRPLRFGLHRRGHDLPTESADACGDDRVEVSAESGPEAALEYAPGTGGLDLGIHAMRLPSHQTLNY